LKELKENGHLSSENLERDLKVEEIIDRRDRDLSDIGDLNE